MLDPKTSLAIDAAPIAPYDDGFSTDSEDYTEQDAATVENQSNIQRQQIQDGAPTNAVKQASEGKAQLKTSTILKTGERSPARAHAGIKPPSNGHLKPQGATQTVAPTPSDKTHEEYCRSCKGYLTSLAERLKVMKTAASQQYGKNPPPSRQCCCCHITYPFVALTDESRNRTCSQPRCYMCNWAATAATKSVDIGVQRTVDGAVKDATKARENGYTITKESSKMATKSDQKNTTELNENCCKSCKGKLPSLAERLKAMKATAEQPKDQRWRDSPPTRQCTCCFITFPLASLTEKSRSVTCAKPICHTCDGARRLASMTEEKAPIPYSTQPNPEKTPEIIVIDGGEDGEEGELVEQETCKCCGGNLIPPVKRVQMMKEAAQKLRGKKPPPSRQCACCRATYPYEALTRKSRKLTRAVPICLKCCQAGGSAIYEMLAVSDEFVEAFKAESPEVARELLKKKENGSLAVTAEAQRNRSMMMKKKKTAQVPSTQTHKQSPKRATPPSIQKPQKPTGRLFGGPRYQLVPKQARKSMPITRLIIGRPATASYATSEEDSDAEDDQDLDRGSRTVRKSMPAPRLIVGEPQRFWQLRSDGWMRKCMPAPRLILGSLGDMGADVEEEEVQQEDAAQSASRVPQSSRTARWFRQFELVDGKTVPERRLEARNDSKEHQLDKKRQRKE